MAKHRKTAYELSQSQVSTPAKVVSLFWRLTKNRRERLGKVLDLGAGDARFCRSGNFQKYVGVEIDRSKSQAAVLPDNAKLINNCAFKHRAKFYDGCIGNPPYVRHHDIESPWKETTVARLEDNLGIVLNKHCNLYLYFLCLGLIKTKAKGIVALLIPYEWVSRPSAASLREYIRKQKWDVTVYRFQQPIFKDVLTTASVSIVDKSSRRGRWRYFDITPDFRVKKRNGVSDSKGGVLKYSDRGDVWALRGLSPGSQKVFTLTEGERLHFGLSKRDVVPCVTTLKGVPASLKMLTKASFKTHFVDAGKRCWLIKSFSQTKSARLDAYLSVVPETARDNYTCRNQTPWFNYAPHPVPQMLFGSGFTKFGPKVLINSVGAVAVGSVWGVHSRKPIPQRRLQQHLLDIDFEKRVVAHARTLKKIEVKQLNTVLNKFAKREHLHGHK
jgi:Eco57I restriction-modification methylase